MKVLVAGASGLVGLAAVRHFAALPGWDVVGISRRVPEDVAGAAFLSLDLMDAAACRRAATGWSDVTHVVYAALHEVPGLFAGWTDDAVIDQNAAMLRNLFDPLVESAQGLEHVSLLHGTKAYGLHHPDVGTTGLHIPLRERERRREHRNFYFLQEDYLRGLQSGAGWGLTVFRPTVIYGEAAGANMNPVLAIGAYAALLKERGEPLYFPGNGEARLLEAVDADLVASALAWAAASPAARDETFNLTNGDVFLWDNAWPVIAESMGMAPGETRRLSLAEELPQRQEEWAAIVRRHGLRAPEDVVAFAGSNSLVYADMLLGGMGRGPVPALNSTIKARQAGFHDCIDTEDMFRRIFGRLRERRLLP
jgi:nucleoside-diphosphate-sugar epimerase